MARAMVATLVFFCVAGPLHAAEEEARVLMLHGVDPYLPPFLAMDKAMRETVAGTRLARRRNPSRAGHVPRPLRRPAF
jgi:hypothetical protein